MKSNTLSNLRRLDESIDEAPEEDFIASEETSFEPADAPEGDEFSGDIGNTEDSEAIYPEFFSNEEFLSELLTELANVSSEDLSELSDEELKDKQSAGYARIKSIMSSYCEDCAGENAEVPAEEAPSEDVISSEDEFSFEDELGAL